MKKAKPKNTKKEKKPNGRPTKYKKDFDQQVMLACRLGATDLDLAALLRVDVATIYRWRLKHETFCEAIKKGKEIADQEIAKSLYQRAKGYKHQDDKIFCNSAGEVTVQSTTKHYPPDTVAAIFWLCNRQKEMWRNVNRIEHTGKDGAPIEMKNQWDKIIDAIQAAVSDPEERKAIYDKLASKL